MPALDGMPACVAAQVLVLSVPEKDVDAVFDVIDVDNNGVIDEQEFQQARAAACAARWCVCVYVCFVSVSVSV